MRLYEEGTRLLLDPESLGLDRVMRSPRYKMRCRKFVEGEDAGRLVLGMPESHAGFSEITEAFGGLAQKLGCALLIDPALERRFLALQELAEEHYRLGNEIKRGDHKFDDKLGEFRQVVDDAMERKLVDRQMRDAFFLASMARAGNFSVPGSGKTATVLGAFAFLAERGLVDRLMVVCPKNAFDSWRTEWRACFGSKRPLSCFSTQDAGYAGLGRADKQRYIRTGIGGANLILVNYEASMNVADDLAKVAADRTLLVFDEVHRVKAVKGKQAKAALTISEDSNYTYALTGTPLPNTYVDLYNFLHILYPHEYDNFFGFKTGELKNASDAKQVEVNEKIQPFFCRTTKDDLGVPRAEPDELLRVDSDVRDDQLVGVLKNRYRKNKLTLMLRLLQMENDPVDLLGELDPEEYRWILEQDEETGEVDVVDYSDKIVDMINSLGVSKKRARCVQLVHDLVCAGRPVIVWCIFRKSMDDLCRDLKARGIEASMIYGDVALEDRSQILDDFRAGKFQVLITNPHTLAESVSLHSVCHDAAYYEYSFNLVHLLQSKDRIHRLGLPQDQQTRYYFLWEEYGGEKTWSLDYQIYERLRKKEDTMLAAIDAAMIETQPTTEEDLEAIFAGLFDE
ncbi:DEAD/DEAH box helicase [Paratractidigestivibacter sp.]|uniref:DEAD/DEAH box helicase n=1 Tax=Paratractidigestivibacter sp. TaxID=2847316 RepID=UPI002ABD3372|nr:DEAD/DEAH box helicase [Paratractidigestivibacter sp.]